MVKRGASLLIHISDSAKEGMMVGFSLSRSSLVRGVIDDPYSQFIPR